MYEFMTPFNASSPQKGCYTLYEHDPCENDFYSARIKHDKTGAKNEIVSARRLQIVTKQKTVLRLGIGKAVGFKIIIMIIIIQLIY